MFDGLLLNAVTVDVQGDGQAWPGGEGLLTVESADFGGGAVVIEVSGRAGTWILQKGPDGEVSFGSNVAFRFAGPAGFSVRARLEGSTTPAPVTVAIAK